uniref:Insulin-like domain-containing protein n=1 Tax=Romanomermis culicivorax TaxID=13658 RepID=A0A915JZD6_ROMCU
MASPMTALCCAFALICYHVGRCQGVEQNGISGASHQLVRRCGSRLVDLLKELCTNCFNGGNRFTSRLKSKDDIVNLKGSILYFPFFAPNDMETSKRNSKMTAAIRTPTNRGIIDQCCIKQCTYNYLKSYCSDECDWIQNKKKAAAKS